MQIASERGYLIPAVNTENKNYIACAQQLAHSIKQFHPEVKICLLTDLPFADSVFDYVRLLPHGDLDVNSHWKLSNDWQCYTASPFRQTIKIEADMIASSPIDHWWTLLEKQDLVVSLGCRNYYDGVGDASRYRKQFETNSLPDVYNAVTYWRLSSTATSFFRLVKEIFTHWDKFRTLLKFSDNDPTTDIVYAMAVKILGIENCTLPVGYGPTIVHMKKHVIPIAGEIWTKELVWEHTNPGLRINTIAQWGFVHYHVKEWINER